MLMASKGHEGDVVKTAGDKYQLCPCARPCCVQTRGCRAGKRETQNVEELKLKVRERRGGFSRRKERAEDGGEVGRLGMGENDGVTHPLEQGGEGLEGMSCFCHDDLELAVGHPGRFMSGRGWVEMSAWEASGER